MGNTLVKQTLYQSRTTFVLYGSFENEEQYNINMYRAQCLETFLFIANSIYKKHGCRINNRKNKIILRHS